MPRKADNLGSRVRYSLAPSLLPLLSLSLSLPFSFSPLREESIVVWPGLTLGLATRLWLSGEKSLKLC